METTTEQQLAVAFSSVLKDWFTDDEMKQVIEENRKRNDNTCASQDICDANMAMDEAFTKTIGHELELQSNKDTEIWNAAWNIAKKNNFYTNY